MKNKYDIIDLREQGWSVASIAERTGVPRLRVSDEIYQAIEDGVLEPSTNKSVLEALENRAEVRALFKKNGVLSIPEIMSITGVSEATAWRHVGALGLLDKLTHEAPVRTYTYSDEEVMRALRSAWRQVKSQGTESLQVTQYKEWVAKNGGISSEAIVHRFGTWTKALTEAGLPIRSRTRYRAATWTPDQMNNVLKKFVKSGGRTVDEYEAWRSVVSFETPARLTIMRNLGGWKEPVNRAMADLFDKSK